MGAALTNVEKKFVFNFLKSNKVHLEVKVKGEATKAVILEFNNKEVKIKLDDVIKSMSTYNAGIDCFFLFQNTKHVFSTTVLRIQGNDAIITNPEHVVKNLQRKYQRILIEGKRNINIEVKGDILPLDYPVSRVHYFPDKAPVKADFSKTKIDVILKRFKDKVSGLVSGNKIVMLRGYTPRSFLEELTVETGKILYIPNTLSDLKNRFDDTNLDILVKDDWIAFEEQVNSTGPSAMNKAISKYLVTLKDNRIFSEVIIPVLYRNYVVAFIFLVNDMKNPKPIDMKIINYAFQFSRILSYALKISGYFKSEIGAPDTHELPIFDLSPGGFAFFKKDETLEDKLLLNHNVKINLDYDGRSIEGMAKLVRKFQQLNKIFYGFMFIDIPDQDIEYLNSTLYKEKAQ